MRVISKQTLLVCSKKHSEAKSQLFCWYTKTSKSIWEETADVLHDFPSAKALKNNRFVFKICGNKYRLIASIDYSRAAVFINFIGTHNEYDKIDALTVQMF